VPEPSAYWRDARDRLAALGVQPVLIGALAAAAYRRTPRATTDVDFLVRSLDGVPESFRQDGFDVRVLAEPGGKPYVAFIRGHGMRVDAIAAETTYQIGAIERAVDGILTVEDVIIHKLLAWRSRDRDDIDSILSGGHDLDEQYIEHWAREWQVLERWREARADG
jgi:hypothetical protein